MCGKWLLPPAGIRLPGKSGAGKPWRTAVFFSHPLSYLLLRPQAGDLLSNIPRTGLGFYWICPGEPAAGWAEVRRYLVLNKVLWPAVLPVYSDSSFNKRS